jgi:cytochrome c-type biogenesis protein CcmH/NrfF
LFCEIYLYKVSNLKQYFQHFSTGIKIGSIMYKYGTSSPTLHQLYKRTNINCPKVTTNNINDSHATISLSTLDISILER